MSHIRRSRETITPPYQISRVLNLTRLVFGRVPYEIIVDGDAGFSAWCQDILTAAGITSYYDGSGRASAEPSIYDQSELLLIDLGDFSEENLALLRRVREQSLDIPVVAVYDPQALLLPEVIHKQLPAAVELGIAGMLPRTCDGNELQTTVATVLTRQRELDRRTRLAWQHFSDAVLLLDAKGRTVVDANPAAEVMTGYRREDLLRMEIGTLLPHTTHGADEHRAVERALRRHGVVPVAGWLADGEQEVQLTRADGQALPVSLSISQFPYERKLLYLVVIRNSSRQWKRIQQTVQREKQAALQRLTSCVAHEVNNPLQALHNSLTLLLSRSLESDKQQRYLKMANGEVERLIAMVQKLLDIHRSEPEAMRPTYLHRVVESVVELTTQQMHDTQVTLTYDLHPNLPPISGVPSLLKQVVLNLLLNAIEAMPHGGALTIKSYVMVDCNGQQIIPDPNLILTSDALLRYAPQPCDVYVVLEIHDTGVGIEPDELAKVFEPFYSTRNEGRGLGLAICYSIVEKHNGTLKAESVPGQGARFRVTFPARLES